MPARIELAGRGLASKGSTGVSVDRRRANFQPTDCKPDQKVRLSPLRIAIVGATRAARSSFVVAPDDGVRLLETDDLLGVA